MYIYLNTFISGVSCVLPTASLPGGFTASWAEVFIEHCQHVPAT